MFTLRRTTRPRGYDPRQHVTAGELRAMGFYIAEHLPDRAYVRRVAVGLYGEERPDDGTASVGLRVLEPFAA